MSAKANEKAWQNHAFKIVVGTATHPLEYAKFLIQVRTIFPQIFEIF